MNESAHLGIDSSANVERIEIQRLLQLPRRVFRRRLKAVVQLAGAAEGDVYVTGGGLPSRRIPAKAARRRTQVWILL